MFHRQEAGVGFGVAQGLGGSPGVPQAGSSGILTSSPAARLQTQSPPGHTM